MKNFEMKYNDNQVESHTNQFRGISFVSDTQPVEDRPMREKNTDTSNVDNGYFVSEWSIMENENF
jgi:hypothetical protein